MILRNLITKLAFGAALGTVIIAAPAASFAADETHYYAHSDNGSVWSFYPGYVDITTPQSEHRGSDASTGAGSRSSYGSAAHLNSRANRAEQCWHRQGSNSKSGYSEGCN